MKNLLSALIILIFFGGCDNNTSLKSKTNKPVAIVDTIKKTTDPDLVSDTMSLPYQTNIEIIGSTTNFTFDSIVFYQCCYYMMSNEKCYEFKIDSSIKFSDKYPRYFFYKKTKLSNELTKELFKLIKVKKYHSSVGPESTCATKYLFLSYKEGKINARFSIDDCYMSNVGYLSNSGIRKLEEICIESGFKFHFYWSPKYYD